MKTYPYNQDHCSERHQAFHKLVSFRCIDGSTLPGECGNGSPIQHRHCRFKIFHPWDQPQLWSRRKLLEAVPAAFHCGSV